MTSFFKRKRKRNENAADPSVQYWEQFCKAVTTALDQPEYSFINNVTLLSTKHTILLEIPIGSRVSTNLVCTLCGDANTCQWLEANISRKCLVLHIQFKSNQSNNHIDKLPKLKLNDSQHQSPQNVSHSKHEYIGDKIKTRLHFRNEDIYKQLNLLNHQIHRSPYSEYIHWNLDTESYEIIYSKKHKHIIARFKLMTTSPSIHCFSCLPQHVATPWVEYSQQRQESDSSFWLVAVLEECV